MLQPEPHLFKVPFFHPHATVACDLALFFSAQPATASLTLCTAPPPPSDARVLSSSSSLFPRGRSGVRPGLLVHQLHGAPREQGRVRSQLRLWCVHRRLHHRGRCQVEACQTNGVADAEATQAQMSDVPEVQDYNSMWIIFGSVQVMF